MIKLKIDVKKIDKEHLFVGKKGTYLDLALFENKDGVDQYGNDGFIVQEVSKEVRDAGGKGPIIGNWQDKEKKGRDRTPQDGYRSKEPYSRDNGPALPDGDDIPFAPFTPPF